MFKALDKIISITLATASVLSIALLPVYLYLDHAARVIG